MVSRAGLEAIQPLDNIQLIDSTSRTNIGKRLKSVFCHRSVTTEKYALIASAETSESEPSLLLFDLLKAQSLRHFFGKANNHELGSGM